MFNIKEQQNKAFESLKNKFGYKNRMQVPRILKVVVSTGVGSNRDKKRLEIVANRLTKITGQKAAPRSAKQSVATFKLRQGEVVGFQTTLRGARMFAFLDKLLNIAFPRTRDFRGISTSIVDEMGNVTIGIRENTIFPETANEELKDVFGMAVTIVTTSKSPKETLAFLEYLGFPFKKE